MTKKNKNNESKQKLRGISPPSHTAGRDRSTASAEGDGVSSGPVSRRESYRLISRHLRLGADELSTALKEIEDCQLKHDDPGDEAFHGVIEKMIDDLLFHSNCTKSFATFSNHGPEHVMEAKKMMADHKYAWNCMDKQLGAQEGEDLEKAEFWQLCCAAFCDLWGSRRPATQEERKLISTAHTYAAGETELSPDEIAWIDDLCKSMKH